MERLAPPTAYLTRRIDPVWLRACCWSPASGLAGFSSSSLA